MKIHSPPFHVTTDGETVTFTGYGKAEREEFNRQIASFCVPGRTYQLTVKEVTASEVQTNYLHVCMSAAAGALGSTNLELRHFFYSQVFDRAVEGFDGNFEYNDWIFEVVNPMTGEVVKKELVPMHQWTVEMMRNFIDLFQAAIKAHQTDFKFPDPEKYLLPKRGRKNEAVNKNVSTVVKIS